MSARKYDFSKREYEPYDLPNGASLYEHDLDKKVACAQCGHAMIYGNGYTSRQIHSPHGFGYMVCEKCYNKEREEERKSK